MGFIDKFSDILKIGRGKGGYDAEKYLDRDEKEPGNAKAHLKLAKIHEKGGKREEAIKEYLLTAASFSGMGITLRR